MDSADAHVKVEAVGGDVKPKLEVDENFVVDSGIFSGHILPIGHTQRSGCQYTRASLSQPSLSQRQLSRPASANTPNRKDTVEVVIYLERREQARRLPSSDDDGVNRRRRIFGDDAARESEAINPDRATDHQTRKRRPSSSVSALSDESSPSPSRQDLQDLENERIRARTDAKLTADAEWEADFCGTEEVTTGPRRNFARSGARKREDALTRERKSRLSSSAGSKPGEPRPPIGDIQASSSIPARVAPSAEAEVKRTKRSRKSKEVQDSVQPTSDPIPALDIDSLPPFPTRDAAFAQLNDMARPFGFSASKHYTYPSGNVTGFRCWRTYRSPKGYATPKPPPCPFHIMCHRQIDVETGETRWIMKGKDLSHNHPGEVRYAMRMWPRIDEARVRTMLGQGMTARDIGAVFENEGTAVSITGLARVIKKISMEDPA